MRAKPIKVQEQKSFIEGQNFFFVFFKDEDGKSYRTCISPTCGNFKRWEPILREVRAGFEVWLDGLILRGSRLIDADSRFTIARSV